MSQFESTAFLVVRGRCPCKKNRYRIVRNRRTGRPGTAKDARTHEWEDSAFQQLRLQWKTTPTITTTCRVSLAVCYSGPRPDDINVAETVYDALQRARVIANDNLLDLWGSPAIERVKVARGREVVNIHLRW